MFDSPSILDILEDSASIALAYVKDDVDALTHPFTFVISSLSHFGIEGVNNIEDLIARLNQQSDLIEGIGVERYFQDIRDTVNICQSKRSFILPIKVKEKTLDFLMVVYPIGGRHIKCFMFIRLDSSSSSANFDESFYNSYKDDLTELFNFKTFKEHLSRNVRDSRLCLFDLNGFKSINDRFGHEVGDKILHKIGDIMIELADMDAIFYHRSGDEFLILSFGGEEYTLKLIENIRLGMKKYAEENFKDVPIDASFGIVHLTYGKGGVMEDRDFTLALTLSDIAMYKAKLSHESVCIIETEEAKALLSREDLAAEVDRLSALTGRK